MEITLLENRLRLLPEKAAYLPDLGILLVADVHLGKSETFQARGIPIPNPVNQETLDRLQVLCDELAPETLLILGDLFHSRDALVDEVLAAWIGFTQATPAKIQFLVGNHDRKLMHQLDQLAIAYFTESIQVGNLLLSHEPCADGRSLNICGHLHPCVQIGTRQDRLRLPCFYFDSTKKLLMLPSFGAFTGGLTMRLEKGAIAYTIADDAIVPFAG